MISIATPRSPRLLVAGLCLLLTPLTFADSIHVRYQEGTQHGFLVLRNQQHAIIASGDLLKVVHGDRVTSRLLFHFHDGSVDDETAVYTQRGTFHLIRDRHIQKGPAFTHDLDLNIDVPSGRVVLHSKDAKGKETDEDTHLDLPSDLSNGMLLSILTNVRPGPEPVTVSYLAPLGKVRLIHLVITADGKQSYTVGGVRRTAIDFLVKPEIGGLAGVVAPIIGREPASGHVWIVGGEAPAFIRDEHQYFENGPLWTIEQVAPIPVL